MKLGLWFKKKEMDKKLDKASMKELKHFNIIKFAFFNFRNNQCYFHASALTYYTIFSIVPILALLFGVSKGFGLEKTFQFELYKKFPEQKIVIDKLIYWANVYLLEETKSTLITGIGVVVLFYIVIKSLANIEKILNNIWHVRKSRTIVRKFTDYLSILLICPVLLVLAESLTVFIAAEASLFINIPTTLHILISVIIPYVIIWLLFSLLYYFLPNTKVKIKPAIIAGIIAGTIFIFEQWLYINCQFAFTKYNAVYGSFAALPLFLIEVQLGWMIVLGGAELSYSIQNISNFDYDGLCSKINRRQKNILMIAITEIIAKSFYFEKPAPSLLEISRHLNIPMRLTKILIHELLTANIITETKPKGNLKGERLQPAHSSDKLSVNFILDNLESVPEYQVLTKTFENIKNIDHILHHFSIHLENNEKNKLLIDL